MVKEHSLRPHAAALRLSLGPGQELAGIDYTLAMLEPVES